MPYITGSRLKVERASKHLEELEREVRAFFDNNPYRPIRHVDPEDTRYFIYQFPPQPVPPLSLAVIVGDVVHNLRSSLDHIAWQLSLLTTSEPYKNTAFPIFKDTKPTSVTNFKRMTKDVLPDAIRVIEALQPYHAGDTAEYTHLWILNSLWNTDKHRLLNAVPVRLTVPAFSGPDGSIRHLPDGATLMRIPKSAEPEKNLEPEIRREILFEIPGPAGRVNLALLGQIHHVVANEVIPLFARFLLESGDRVDRRIGLAERQR